MIGPALQPPDHGRAPLVPGPPRELPVGSRAGSLASPPRGSCSLAGSAFISPHLSGCSFPLQPLSLCLTPTFRVVLKNSRFFSIMYNIAVSGDQARQVVFRVAMGARKEVRES